MVEGEPNNRGSSAFGRPNNRGSRNTKYEVEFSYFVTSAAVASEAPIRNRGYRTFLHGHVSEVDVTPDSRLPVSDHLLHVPVSFQFYLQLVSTLLGQPTTTPLTQHACFAIDRDTVGAARYTYVAPITLL